MKKNISEVSTGGNLKAKFVKEQPWWYCRTLSVHFGRMFMEYSDKKEGFRTVLFSVYPRSFKLKDQAEIDGMLVMLIILKFDIEIWRTSEYQVKSAGYKWTVVSVS